MGFIKNIARKILQTEIEELKEKVERFESRNLELRGELAEIEGKHQDQLSEVRKEKYEEIAEKAKAERRLQELEKENQILRQYYDLDKEPSDEIKTKIHIDLEINRLKEEKGDLKSEILRLTCRPPVIVQQHYPYYGLGYRPF